MTTQPLTNAQEYRVADPSAYHEAYDWRTAYLNAIWPITPHLSDEDIAAQLDASAKRTQAARKGQETRRQRRAKQEKQA